MSQWIISLDHERFYQSSALESSSNMSIIVLANALSLQKIRRNILNGSCYTMQKNNHTLSVHGTTYRKIPPNRLSCSQRRLQVKLCIELSSNHFPIMVTLSSKIPKKSKTLNSSQNKITKKSLILRNNSFLQMIKAGQACSKNG